MMWISPQWEVPLPASLLVGHYESVAFFQGKRLGVGQSGVLAFLGFSKDLEPCEKLHTLCWQRKVPAPEMELRGCPFIWEKSSP